MHLNVKDAVIGVTGELNICTDLERLRSHPPLDVFHNGLLDRWCEHVDGLAIVEIILQLPEDGVRVLHHCLLQNTRQLSALADCQFYNGYQDQ